MSPISGLPYLPRVRDMNRTSTDSAEFQNLSRKLRQLHAQLLQAEKEFHPPIGGPQLLDKLVNDPAWAWLRALSKLIADIDHVLAQPTGATEHDGAVVAAHLRGLLAGEGDLLNESFLARYRPLLQASSSLASTHGELKALLKSMPVEPENEAERLHARHQWNLKCRHRGTVH
jgi:hypothetical protein